jgi:hypothetical protein
MVSLDLAKMHLRADGNDEDALISAYIATALRAAVHYLDRRVFATQEELTAATAAAPEVLSAARVAYEALILAADLIANPQDRSAATRTAEDTYGRAREAYSRTQDGMVCNDSIRSAMLLMIGTSYAQREDVVIGLSVAQLPVGAHALLACDKAYR